MKKLVKFALAVILALCSQALAASAELSNENQAKLIKHIDSYSSRMSEVALKIWSTPELGYQESKTSALLQDELKKAGFKVEAGVAGIPTAFVARAGTSDGPVIAILAEIDALPGMSQAATPERKPIPDQIAGHACGHHLFGSGSVAAAIAIKSTLQRRRRDALLASGRCEQRLPGSQPGEHQRKVPFSWRRLARRGCSRSRPLRSRRRRGDELHGQLHA